MSTWTQFINSRHDIDYYIIFFYSVINFDVIYVTNILYRTVFYHYSLEDKTVLIVLESLGKL